MTDFHPTAEGSTRPITLVDMWPLVDCILDEERPILIGHQIPDKVVRRLRRCYLHRMKRGQIRQTVCVLSLGRSKNSPIFIGVASRHLRLDPQSITEQARRFAFGRAVGQLKAYLEEEEKNGQTQSITHTP
uniref:Uncharacterized protein n=1 Tax=viral metagenome TaxID=1070528 RepID=A0A6H1ZJL6_9ZZZZ